MSRGSAMIFEQLLSWKKIISNGGLTRRSRTLVKIDQVFELWPGHVLV